MDFLSISRTFSRDYCNYREAVTDRPYYFVASFVYTLPFGAGQFVLNSPTFINKLVGGREINGITTRDSGFPADRDMGCMLQSFPPSTCRPAFPDSAWR